MFADPEHTVLNRGLKYPDRALLASKDFLEKATEYVIALTRTIPNLFGQDVGIEDILDINKAKLKARLERGTILKTDEIFGDDR